MTRSSSIPVSLFMHRLRLTVARALLVVFAPLPALASAQGNIDNVRYIGMPGGRSLAEVSVSKWVLDGRGTYTEAQRTATSIQLRPTGDWTTGTPLSINLASRRVFMEYAEINGWNTVSEVSDNSGMSVQGIDVTLRPNSSPGFGIAGSFRADAGTNPSWTLQFRSGGDVSKTIVPASGVSRSPRGVVLKSEHGDIAVDVVSRTCTLSGFACTVNATYAATGFNVGSFKTERIGAIDGKAYKGTLTQVGAQQWREELLGTVDAVETARNVDYVELRYSNGYMQRFFTTGQVQHRVAAGWQTDPNTRILALDRQWPGQIGAVPVPVSPGVSPGFQIQNKTDYPVLISLEQVGCLYYGIVPPGQVFVRNTGAVWFTIKASMAPDLKEPTAESCLVKPAIFIGKVLAAGAMIAGTMGMGTALVVPAMLATAAGEGSAIAVQAYATSQGASATDAASTKVLVTTLARGATVAGLVLAAGSSLPFAAGAALQDSWLNVGPNLAFIGGTELHTRLTAQSDVDEFNAQLTQQASVTGAYAGYPWPWPSSDRVMPRYDITGGPRIRTMPDGTTVLLKQDRPLTITKVN